MKNKLALIAFGGNVMLPADSRGSAREQYNNTKKAARLMVNIIKKGYELIIVHGNGPQVGNILIQMETASNIIPPSPTRCMRRHDRRQYGLHAGKSTDE